MSETQNRDFGRDGVSGLVDKDRALRARLLGAPRRAHRPSPVPDEETLAREVAAALERAGIAGQLPAERTDRSD